MSKRLTEIKTERIKGIFWRGIPERFVSTSLEPGPNFHRSTRYSVQRLFSGLYFSSSVDLSKAEIAGKVGEDGEPVKFLKYEIDIDDIVDFRNQKSRDVFGVTLEEITRHKSETGAYNATQRIAKTLYDNGIQGLIAPSAHHPSNAEWANLVIYPANVIRAFIREKS